MNKNITKSRITMWIINVLLFFIFFILLNPMYLPYFFLSPLTLVILVNIPLIPFYNHRISTGKGRIHLAIMRIIAIIVTAICVSVSLILFCFENTKALYPVKKVIFSYGVRNEEIDTMDRFPQQLPQNMEDYLFVTQPSKLLQDYYPLAILSFRTDKATMEQFEAECKEMGCQLVEYNASFDEYLIAEELVDYKDDEEFMEYQKHEYSMLRGLPINAFLEFPKDKQEDIIGNSVIYTFNTSEHFPHGYAFDYDSGLVVIWG